MDKKMNRKNVLTKTSAKETRGKARSTMSARATSRRTDKLTSGGSTNSHSRRGIFGALLSVLMASVLIATFAIGTFADDLVNTVPTGEATGDFYTGSISTGFVPNGYNTSAQYGPGYGPYNVPGVVQSQSTTSATSFASGLPLGTIFIDQSKISASGGIYKKVSDNPAILAGLVDGVSSDNKRTQMYDGTLEGAIKLKPNKINRLDGDLYSMTFEDAAILPNGDRADLVVTYSNARIVIDQRYASAPSNEQYLHDAVYLSRGNEFSRGTLDKTNFRTLNYGTAAENAVKATAQSYGTTFGNSNAPTPAVGITMDATYTIINKNKTPAEGTFVFAISGINLDRDPDVGGSNNVNKPLWYSYNNNFGGEDGTEHSFFSEAMSINGGQVSDNVYIRPNNDLMDNPTSTAGDKGKYFWPNVSKDPTTGQIKFISNATNSPSLGGHDESYSAGFVVLADASQGLKVTGTGHGGGNATNSMQSGVFASKQIWYRYTSKTGPHGNIQITSEGNYNKKLTDGGDVLGPGTYVVTEGKTVTYTMTPDTGYKLSTLKLNGKNIKFNTEDINRMKKGDSLTATTAAGRDATLKYETDGTYSLVIPYAEHDESVEVTWEPTTADILYYKTWDDKDDKDGMRVGADGTSDWPEVKLQQSIDGGASWTDVTKDAFGGNLTKSQPVPSGKDTTSGEYLDGLYDKQNGTTTHPYTWQYLPVYTYDSNGADRVIQYRIVEGDEPGNDPALTGYKNPKYFDGQSFFLSSEELKSIDGWIVYKDSTTGKYYVSKEDGIDKDDAKYDGNDSDYYEVINWKVQNAKATPQPNKANLSAVISSDSKMIGTEQVLRDPNTGKEYVERSGKYHEVFYNSISDVGLTFDPNQGDPDPTTFVNSTMNGYNTADKAIAYQSVGVKNEHTVSDIYVEVLKQWNDANLYNQNTEVANGNQYDRRNITFTLHGTKPNGDVVDLNPGDPSTPDLSITLDRGETDSKTDRQTAGGFDIVKDTTNGKEYVLIGSAYYEVTSEDEDAVTGSYRPKAASVQPDAGNLSPVTGEKANGEQVLVDSTDNKKYVKVTTGTGTSAEEKYHEVVSIDKAAAQGGYAASPASPQPDRSNLTDVYKSTYKIDDNNFGATFYGLQAYKDGQLINYTVTESYNDVDAWSAEGAKLNQASTWTVTGGMLTENGDGSYTMSGLSEIKQNEDLKGYTGKFINTPIVDDEFKQLPVTIKKKDAFTGQPLEGATFTVYTDAFNRDAGSQPTSSFQELEGYTLYKDPSYDKQYVKINGKYHLVTGTKIADEAADPQPTLTNDNRVKNDNYKQINGKDVETDRKGHNYIKEGNKYYEVDSEGNVSSTEANPQPTGTLHKIKTSGAVDQVNVVTDKNGDATINFNQTGTYYIVESSSPDGYEDESDKTYRFTVDKKLMKVTFEEASSSDDHDTSFWKRLYDLIFGNGTTTDREVWNQVNDRSGTLTLKNTPITANIMTRKVWDDADDQDGVRPTDAEKLPKVELQYTTDDVTDDSVTPTWSRAQVYDSQTKQLKDVDVKQFTNAGGAIHADPNNAYTWLNLPAYRNGKVVYYRLVETSPVITDGTYKITKNETVASHDSEFTLVNSNLQPRNQIVEIVNEHKPQTLTINAVKRWNDHSDEDETRPKTLKITLWKTVNNVNTELYSLNLNGEADAQTTAGYYELAPTDNGDTWNAIFKTLPAYENGSPITYYMVETLTDTDKQNYVEEYSISYTDTTGAAVTTKRENKVVAKDVKRTYEEEKFDNKTVYTAGGKRYVKQDDQYYEILKVTTYTTGSAADPQPEASNLTQTDDRTTDTDQVVLVDSTTGAKYIYISDEAKYYSVVEHVNEYISDTAASQQPTDPEKVYTDTENTDATISVENTSKNNVSTKKYWIGGANANIRFHLFRTTQTGSAIAMETKKTTAEPIATSDSIGGETVYIHANGKRYVRRADPADADKFVYHEINEADDSIATTGIPYTDIEIRTWTPYDLDANGKRQYVKKTDSALVISEDQYNALETDAEKAKYELKTKNGWELVDQHLFVSSAFNTSLSLPGDDEPHLFEDLPAFDNYGNPYTYRILETTTAGNTEDERFEGHYSENGHTVTNINKKVQSGETDIDVMKDLEGRAWRTEAQGDIFFFYIDPLKQVNENNGTITEFNDSEATDKAEIPIPSDGKQWGRAVKDNTAIGSTIREVSFSPIIYELSDIDSSTHTSTYYYKVYESRNTDGDPVYHTDNRGITYDGSLNESTGVWTPKTLIMKVVATADGNGVVTTTHQWAEYKNDGKALEWSSETPAFKNEYSSASDAKLWIEKNISDRAWVPYNNGKGDAYQFTINSISGAPLNMEHTTQDGAYYTMPLVTKSTSGNPQEDLQNYDTSSWAFGITGDPIDGSVLDSNGRAEFVYEVFERPSATSDNRDSLGLNNYKVENLEYDTSKKYVKVTVQDNWDGTLRFDAQYYSDASCLAKYLIPGNQRWIEDKTEIVYLHNNSKLDPADPNYVGPTSPDYKKTAEQYNNLSEENKNKYFLSKVQSKRLLSEDEVASIGEMTGEEIAEAGYRQVNVAHFTNIESDDIVVKKEWVGGPAVEDVSLHLVRHLFDLSEEENLNKTFIDDEEAKYKEETGKDDFWQVISRRYDVSRGDFLKDDGTPKYDSGSTTTSSQTYGDLKDKNGNNITEPDFIENFNSDLPKYVWVTETDSTTGKERNVLKRAVYKLVEDDTSDAYEESYRTSKAGQDDVEGSQYYIDGETLIVTNTVKATNTANIAAVKQLLGRNWIETDEFPFELKAIGAGKYYKKGETGGSEGEFKEPDYSAEAVAKVPMPAVYVKTESDPEEIITQTRYNELTDEEKAEYTKKSTNSATATSDTTTVDPNGGLERLARFDEIVFTINDLVYNGKSKHYQGDFFYTMTEKLPEILTTGDNQSYPTAYTYTYKTTEGGKTVNKTETVNITDKSIPSTVPQDGTIAFIEWNNGITYDMTEHTVHIKVRENRTGTLEVQVGYDEDEPGTISTGTQFTPVYTNKYSAETEVAVSVEKRIMGRKWKTSDKFDFIMNPLGGAPFTDADKTEFPEGEGEDDGSDSDVQAAINADKAAHTERGAHIKRMTIDSEAAQGSNPQTMPMPKLLFKYSDLNQIVGQAVDKNGDPIELYYGNDDSDEDNKVPDGTSFGQFIYAFEEQKYKNITPDIADLERDPDTEYARITVIDKRDGTLDYYIEIFEDRYCTKPRTKPGTDEPADKVTFVNQLKRDLSVTKAWADPAISDVTLRLEWAVIDKDDTDDTLHWQPVDETIQVPGITGRTEWLHNVDGSKTISKDATGSGLTVTWTNLPAYADITRHDDRTGETGDDSDLNDLWIYYRVVEEPVANVDTRYNETAYAEGDTLDTKVKKDGADVDKYQIDANGANPFHTGPEKVGGDWVAENDRVKDLYVTNFPKDLDDKVDFGVVKQYIGKVWTNEEFTFMVEPVKAKRGDETDYTRHNTSTTVYINNEDPEEVLTEEAYEALTDPDKADKYTAKTTTYRMPTDISSNTAVASKTSPEVSDNEHAANFKGLTIKMSDLKRVPNDTTNSDLVKYRGKDYGEFIYKITEVLPPDAEATTEVCDVDEEGHPLYYTVATDSKGNKINYTTEEHFVKIIAVSDGNEIDFTVSYDGRDAGQFVPVFTNYALMPTPIEGTKTWIGGKTEDHVNGSVVLDDNKKNILEGEGTDKTEDKRNLKLYRKSAKKGSSAEPVTEDDARNPLAIVWVKAERTPVTTEEYVETVDTSVKSGKTYYRDDDGEYIAVTPEEGANPSAEGWYEKISVTRYESKYEEQETGNGTYTIKAKVSKTEGGTTTVSYEDPYLNLLDEDGYEYTYSVVEESVPNGYEETYKGLHVKNTYNVKDDLKVTKTWDDAQNAAGLRPDSVTVHLYKEIEVTLTDAEKTAAEATVVQDKYDTDGEEGLSTEEQAEYDAAKQQAVDDALEAKKAAESPVQVEVARKEIKPATGEKDSWATGITWEDLDVYDKNGDIIKYVVVEESVSGYTSTYAVDSKADADYKEAGDTALEIKLDGDTTSAPQYVDIKNSLTPATDTVKVTKVWDDESNKYGDRPENVTFKLYKYVWNPKAASGKGAYSTTKQLVSGTGSSATGRPATKADVDAAKIADPQSNMKVGDIIKIEDLVLDGTAETGSDIDTQANETAATNTYTWNGEWINLPLEEKGKTIIYVVEEDTSDNIYAAKADGKIPQGKYDKNPCIRGDQINGYTATNVYEPETVDAEVTKSWSDLSNKYNTRPDTLTVELWRTYKDANNTDKWEKVDRNINGKTIKTKISADDVDANNNTWKYTVTDLPKYLTVDVTTEGVTTKQKREIVYYWRETVPTGYTATASAAESPAQTATNGVQNVANGGTLTNTYKTGTITLTKRWVDADNVDRLRPTANAYLDMLTLYAGSTKIESSDYGTAAPKIVKSCVDNDNNTFTVTYSNLPVYDKDGNKITYKVEENEPDGYTIVTDPAAVLSTTLDQSGADPQPSDPYTGTMSLTNKHVQELIDVEVTKNWIDAADYEHDDVATYKNKLKLYRVVGGNTRDVTDTYADKLSINPASDGKTADTFAIKWTGLPKCGLSANELVEATYYVTEETVTGYAVPVYDNKGASDKTKKSETTAAYDGGEINNTQKISIDVKKTWNDNNNHDNKRGDITVVLFRNGNEYEQKTLKETDTNITKSQDGNTWTWTGVWKNLPYADDKGNTYNYTASEEAPQPWYQAFVDGQKLIQILLNTWNDANDTLIFEVTNKHDDETVGFTVDKIWNDGSNVDGMRPDTITYKLYQQPAGGEKTQVTELPTGASIKYADAAGTDIEMASNGDIVVNTKKTDDTQGTLGRIVFSGLPKYAVVGNENGKEITYTIVEKAIRGYNLDDSGADQDKDATGAQGTGFTVTNVHNPISIDVTPVAKKALNGRKFKSGDEFTFKMAAAETNPASAPTPTPDWVTIKPESGSVADIKFSPITFTGDLMADKLNEGETKTFEYNVTEVEGGIDKITYSTQTLKLTVTLKREADGSITKTYSWTGGDDNNHDTITNTFNAETSLIIRKIWEDKDADKTSIGSRPDSITVVVTAVAKVDTPALVDAEFEKDTDASTEGEVIYTKEYTVSKLQDGTLFNDNVWQKDISGIPLNDADDNKITYSVTEKPVPNYTKEEKDDNGRFIIKNTYTRGKFTGTKVWVDGGKKHDNTTEVKLTVYRQAYNASGNPVGNAETVSGAHIHWEGDKFTITGLPGQDANGNTYTYWVSETKVNGYNAPAYSVKTHTTGTTVDGIESGGTITNAIEQEYVEIPVKKVWVGEPTDEVTVQLKKGDEILESHKFEAAGDYTFTRNNGDGKAKGYEKYDSTTGAEILYTVDEVVPADAEFTKTITGNMTDGFVVTNTSVKTTDIYAQKQWAGDNDVRDGRENVEFKLIQTIDDAKKDVADYTTDVDGESKEIKGTQTIKADKTAAVNTDAGTVNWPNLPMFDKDGNRITYTVEEISAPEGYTASDVTGEGTQAKPFIIKNTLNDETVDVPVRIVWDDKKDQEGERPDNVVVRVQVKDGDEWTEVYVKDGKLVDESTDGATKVDDATLNKDNNWKKLFKDLPAKDSNGNTLEYRVVEMDGDKVVDGVTEMDLPGKSGDVDYTAGIAGNQNDGFVITNSYLPGTVSVTAIKQWYGDKNVKKDTRKDVRIMLIGHINDDDETQIAYIGKYKTIEVNKDVDVEKDAGSVTWTGLPKKVDGKELIWTVYEDSVPGYIASVGQKTGKDGKTENGEAEFIVTNKYVGSVSTVKAIKVWEDGNNQDGKRADVWFQLYRKIGGSDEEKVGEPKKVVVNETAADGTNAGQVTWENLPDIIAETKEESVDKYTAVDPAPTPGDPITDEWYEPDGNGGYEPTENTTVQDGKTYYTKTTKTIKKEAPERAVVYTVKEVKENGTVAAPDGYTSTVVQTEPGVFEARNVHVPEKTSVDVKVVWDDDNDADGVRPDHVVVKLKDDKGNEQVAKARITYKDTDAGWMEAVYTFDDLPKYKDGELITYTVVELDKDEKTERGNGTTAFDGNYSVTISGDGSENPYVITNIHNAGSVDVKVVKEWAGDEGHEAETRKDVTVHLIQVSGGARKEVKEPKTITFDSSDPEAEMSAGWEGLPTVVKGESVTYEVKEDEVSGYTMTGNDFETDDKGNYTFTITNTYGHVASHDVIYVDPKNPDGKMIIKSDKYSQKEAQKQAQGKLNPPANPSHKGTKFIGWAVNYDEKGNWVLVAKYQDNPVKPVPTISYIDPQSGKPVIKSVQTNNASSVKPPKAPKAKNMQFVGWTKSYDAAGNVIFTAKYKADCSNGAYTGEGKSVPTGDTNSLIIWIIVIGIACAAAIIFAVARVRNSRK